MKKTNRYALAVLLFGGSIIFAALAIWLAVSPGQATWASDAPFRIIGVHEHIRSIEDVPKLLAAMDDVGIKKTVLMGSSIFTLTLNQNLGFTQHHENNEELLRICRQYPDRFEAWPTMDGRDSDKLERFKDYVSRGATGLKLYLGHGFIAQRTGEFMFHTVALDDPEMLRVYEYCQENFIPVCLHVNPSPITTPGFAEQFVAVLEQFPDLKIICPHFMLSSIADHRLRELLDTFPNLYTDISFGHDDFLIAGIKRISESPRKFRDIFTRYPDRFMFAADLVVTDEPVKTREWIRDRFQTYVDMLTKAKYTTPVLPGEELTGLNLTNEIVNKILYQNYLDFVASKPKGTVLQKEINWQRMRIDPVDRKPGEPAQPIMR